MANDKGYTGLILKIVIGMILAALIFISWMTAEQRGWVNTDIAGTILRQVDAGKANVAAERENAAKGARATSTAQATTSPVLAPQQAIVATPAASNSDDNNDSDDSASGDDSDSDNTDSDSDSSDDDAKPAADNNAAPKAATKAAPKKIDYAVVAKRPATWPKAVQVRTAGSRVTLTDKNKRPIGKVEIPVGTRVFIVNVDRNGLLTVRNEAGQTFSIHATRTTFRKLYTGKPLATVVRGESSSSYSGGGSSSKKSAASDDFDDDDDDDSGSSGGSGSDDDDDFFDDDF
ncbi:MAG: hypothetical protein LUD39_01105 [Opitutae bacterium]|nr:hypothetical protein [Opitutae bacterium]MCD8298345.1 hypothetical protein [Opitutae bacterium]